MQLSYRWLKDYVDIDLTPTELADLLTMTGLEVEAVHEKAPAFTGVVTANISSIKPHPHADKLSLCEVSTGEAVYPVVCGAPNIRVDDIVPLAKVGAGLPGGLTIRKAEIRGVVSEGMLCSEKELGIGEDETGVMILSRGTDRSGCGFAAEMAPGKDLAVALDLQDAIFEIGITPNRSDCLSVIGVAREIAALTGRELRYPDLSVREGEEDIVGLTSVEIVDSDLCPRYTARIIKDVNIMPSPLWMRLRLEAAGLRAINGVVDVTNFVMMELGQPLHAFDHRLLAEGRIVVRRARRGEAFTTLDGKDRTLGSDTLMICDGLKPVAIGGIMGGLNSEVAEDTRTILLESAYFNPTSIRRTSRSLAISTDASFRFERGVDPEGVTRALDRAASLMAAIAGGRVCKNIIDCYPRKISTPRDIPLRVTRANEILGTDLNAGEVTGILERLAMSVDSKNGEEGIYRVTPPTFRVDIAREIDLIEEVARVYGYERIPVTHPVVCAMPVVGGRKNCVEETIRRMLRGGGYSEVITYSFVSPEAVNVLGLAGEDERHRMVRIRNPFTEDQAVMRTTIIYSLLETMRKNARAGCFDLKIFETGKVFFATNAGELPREANRVGGLLTGLRYDDLWHFTDLPADFYDLKGVLENIFAGLRISDVKFDASDGEAFLHPGRSCGIYAGDRYVGFLGEVHQDVLSRMDLKNRSHVFEIDIDILADIFSDRVVYSEISKFPSSSRDVAFLVEEQLEADKMIDIARRAGEDLLEKVSIFDVYQGKGIPLGLKSIGLRFSYRSFQRTLTDDEINLVHGRIVKTMVASTGAKIRGEER
ncbi:MAG: phenylalanine--tRNA ligase subunit beta [Deltaproteobacteria bacterium]|nr:phenylalanine--tRNA ligase subunit beta [Deltaproteobacteria bacterium]